MYYAIFGWAMIGWLVPELFAALSPSKLQVPLGMNIACMVAFGLIATAYWVVA